MVCTQFVSLCGLTCADEIPQGLVSRIRHSYRRQLAGSKAPRQAFSVALIRYHTIPRL
jgi:hypothetical protein